MVFLKGGVVDFDMLFGADGADGGVGGGERGVKGGVERWWGW